MGRETQIKTTVGCHLTLVRKAVIKTRGKFQPRCGYKGTLVHCWRQIGSATVNSSMEIFISQKNKVELSYEGAISGHISKGNEDRSLKRYIHFHIYYFIIYNSQDMEIIHEWIKMCVCVHVHTIEYYLAMK